MNHRYQHEVGEERSGADDGRITDADDVADSDDGGVVEETEGHELAFEDLAETNRTEAEQFGPGVEGGGEAVERCTQRCRQGQCLGLAADLLAGDQDLGGRGAFRPRQFAVEFDHEVITKGDQKEDAQAPAEKGNDDHLEYRRLGDPGARFRGQHV